MNPQNRKASAPLRIGVIGLGKIAVSSHLPGFAKVRGCRITAVSSSREEFAKDIAKQYSIPAVYRDWKQMLKSPDLDAVSICTPNFSHAPMTLMALQEGKDVLVEKPMATSVRDARRMVETARRKKRVLMVHHNMRFDPGIRTARELLRRNVIGQVFAFRCTMAHKGPQAWSPNSKWFFDKRKSGGGVLMDLGPHMLGSLLFLLEDFPLTVEAALPGNPGGWMRDGEAHCSCLLRFKGGAVGSVNLSWADVAYQNRIYFFGTKGTLHVNLSKGDPITLQYRDKDEKIYLPLMKKCFRPSLYDHFADCVKNQKEPWSDGVEGLNTVRIIEAGYQSERERRTIRL